MPIPHQPRLHGAFPWLWRWGGKAREKRPGDEVEYHISRNHDPFLPSNCMANLLCKVLLWAGQRFLWGTGGSSKLFNRPCFSLYVLFFPLQSTWWYLKEQRTVSFLRRLIHVHPRANVCKIKEKTKGKFPGQHHLVWIGKTKHTS